MNDKTKAPFMTTMSTASSCLKEGVKLSGSQTVAMMVATLIESRVLGWKTPEDKPELLQGPLAEALEPGVLCMLAHMLALYFEGVPNRDQVLKGTERTERDHQRQHHSETGEDGTRDEVGREDCGMPSGKLGNCKVKGNDRVN